MQSASLSNGYEHVGEARPRTSLRKAKRHASSSTMQAIDVTYRVFDISSEGGKSMCSCASCLPTGWVSKYTVVFVGQASGVLDDIRLRCRIS